VSVAEALRQVARHRASGDHEGLHHALVTLASAALRWADRVVVGDIARDASAGA
jgi:hypothetical protein